MDLRDAVAAALLMLLTVTGTAAAQARPRFSNPPAQVPLDSTGRLVGGSDFRAQARQVFENLRSGLQAAGASFGDVVKLTYYVLDAKQLPMLREVRDQYVNTAAPPASSLVEVRGRFRDDVLLEVDAIAVVRP